MTLVTKLFLLIKFEPGTLNNWVPAAIKHAEY